LSFSQNSENPFCYGVLDKVFPIASEGLREIRVLCWSCSLRVDCLRDAINSQNESKKQIQQNTIISGGIVRFLQRWSFLKNKKKTNNLEKK